MEIPFPPQLQFIKYEKKKNMIKYSSMKEKKVEFRSQILTALY